MANTGDLYTGAYIRFNGELCQIMEYQHRTPGNLRAFYQVKMRKIKTGKSFEHRFRSGEEVELVRVEFKKYQFLYKDSHTLVCMDNTTYDQIDIQNDLIGDNIKFLKEGMELNIAFEGDVQISAELPNFIELEITYTEPGLRGDTATNTLKQATVETGAIVNVPLFVNTGDKIRIDTRTGAYLERAK